jgi:hypothetical protein
MKFLQERTLNDKISEEVRKDYNQALELLEFLNETLDKMIVTSARVRMQKYWIHAKKKIFIPSLFMAFLDVFEVPEHDETIKNLVSVCLCVCHHDYSTFLLYYRGRGSKMFAIILWWTDKFLSFRAWQFRDVRDKNITFSGYFWNFLNFSMFLWIDEHINIVAEVNAHLMM